MNEIYDSNLDAPSRGLVGRHLQAVDIPALMRLERRQWDESQAACEADLLERIESLPELCVGTFCERTGDALCSLFLRPIEREKILVIRNWDECADRLGDGVSSSSRSLFGISMTSIDPQALRAMEAYIWPRLLAEGWRELYLGSPMPGLRQALSRDPLLNASDYARARRRQLPRDPQLRYYHQKGLPDIVAVLPGYFPHGDALDYGVLLRGDLEAIASRTCDVQAALGPVDELCEEDDVEGAVA